MPTNNIPEHDKDNIKLIYDKVYDELNRCRDWPVKVITFTSALYIALFGFLKLDSVNVDKLHYSKWFIVGGVIIFWIFIIKIIRKQHLLYLEYRNTQIKLQKLLGIYDWVIEDQKVIPSDWSRLNRKSMWVKVDGWLFYAVYLTVISAFSCLIII